MSERVRQHEENASKSVIILLYAYYCTQCAVKLPCKFWALRR